MVTCFDLFQLLSSARYSPFSFTTFLLHGKNELQRLEEKLKRLEVYSCIDGHLSFLKSCFIDQIGISSGEYLSFITQDCYQQ